MFFQGNSSLYRYLKYLMENIFEIEKKLFWIVENIYRSFVIQRFNADITVDEVYVYVYEYVYVPIYV